jgi:hypothetical protein
MRSKGSKTQSICWKLEVVNQNEIIFTKDYCTLKEVANEIGMTYNQVVELSSGRKKQPKGRFDTNYRFIKLSGKLNENPQEVKEVIEGNDNPSMNGLGEDIIVSEDE